MTELTITPGKTRIGWIGTGVMGRWMCQHLITKGFSATVYNRCKDKAKPLLDRGAKWADTPKAVARAVRRRLRHRRLSRRTCARCSSAPTEPWPGASRHGPRGHDHERAVAGAGNLRGREGEGRGQRSMPRCRAATSGPRSAALHHDRRRQGSRGPRSTRSSRRWARRSSTRAPPARASTPRW